MSRAKAKIAGVVAFLLITISLASAQTSYWINSLGDGDYFIQSDGQSYSSFWLNSMGGGDYSIQGSNGYSAYFTDLGSGDGYFQVLTPQFDPSYQQ